MRRRGRIVDVDATVKEERTLPYAVGILFSLAALIILYLFGSHSMIIGLWAAYILNSGVLLLINKTWKMSAHAMGVAIPFAALLFIGNLAAVILFFILILVCWSRIKLGVHTLSQVTLGSLSGMLFTLLVYYLI
jgi:membrane-associated phospholipid phosphatase